MGMQDAGCGIGGLIDGEGHLRGSWWEVFENVAGSIHLLYDHKSSQMAYIGNFRTYYMGIRPVRFVLLVMLIWSLIKWKSM